MPWAALAGVMTGLALASKFNMIVLPVLLIGTYLWKRSSKEAIPVLLVWGACAFLALAMVYRGAQLPLYGKGLWATIHRLGEGRSSFLMGEYSLTGFWGYFPVAFSIKTPIPLLLLGFGALFAAVFRREFSPVWVLMPMLGYFAVALTSKVQIGFRHLLPLFPFFVLMAGHLAGWLFQQRGAAALFVLFLALWQAVGVWRMDFRYLAYFNEWVGGPSKGYQYLVDSNLDWGQELKSLGQELHRLGDPPVYLSYFGSADPAAYGIRYKPVLTVSNVENRKVERVHPAQAPQILLAVSATNLQAAYWADRHVWDWLKNREPLRGLGYSLFLYDLTKDGEGLKRLADLFTRLGDRKEAEEILKRI
ncbi:MAG: hypothetical protein HY400_03495 [Elusimicrobia bacterium]|nr:hypothetical protein [Elusimicrobiota bacterium]